MGPISSVPRSTDQQPLSPEQDALPSNGTTHEYGTFPSSSSSDSDSEGLESYTEEIRAINSDKGTFLTIDPNLFQSELKVYTAQERSKFINTLYRKGRLSGKMIKTFFSWPYDFPSAGTTSVASISKLPLDEKINDTIRKNRKVYPVFSEQSEQSGPSGCQKYLEDLRDDLAKLTETEYQQWTQKRDHKYKRSFKAFSCAYPKTPDVKLQHNSSKSKVQATFSQMYVSPCVEYLSLIHEPIMEDPRTGISKSQRSDLVICTCDFEPLPLGVIEIKDLFLSAFLDENRQIIPIPIGMIPLLDKIVETSDETEENKQLGTLPQVQSDVKKLTTLINQVVNHMINYGKKWCMVSDLETTIYFEVDTESQIWKDLNNGAGGNNDASSSTFLQVPLKYRVIDIRDTTLTLQTILMSLTSKEIVEQRNGVLPEDYSNSNKGVADILRGLIKLPPKELEQRFGNVPHFEPNQLSEGFDRERQHATTAFPKHVGRGECLKYTPLQEGPETLAQILLFDASDLKAYMPSLKIPPTAKVVMKIYDEILLSDHADDSDDEYHTYTRSRAECVADAARKFIREVANYQIIQNSEMSLNIPYLFDFGSFVLFDKTDLKFSGLFMVTSYIEPDQIQNSDTTDVDVETTLSSLIEIGLELSCDENELNIIVSEGKAHIVDFSQLIVRDGDILTLKSLVVKNWQYSDMINYVQET